VELVYVTVIGAGIGTVVRYILPNRSTYGILLLPAIGAAVTAAVWVGLLWAGWTFDGGWIWVVSLAAGTLASVFAGLLIPRARASADERTLHTLSGGKA
jgi:hypothetical protein